MSRSFDEIKEDMRQAMDSYDAPSIERFIGECEELGTDQSLLTATNARGALCSMRAQYEEARVYYTDALAGYERLDVPTGVAAAHVNLGSLALTLNDPRSAQEHFMRALSIYTDLGHRHGTASVLMNIGSLHQNADEYADALIHFHRALDIWQQIDNTEGVVRTLLLIGSLHNNVADYPSAIATFERVHDLCVRYDKRALLANCLSNLGTTYHEFERYEQARNILYEAMVIQGEFGHRRSVVYTLAKLAIVHLHLNEMTQAEECFLRSLAEMREIGDAAGVTDRLTDLATFYFDTGRPEDAQRILSEIDMSLFLRPKLIIALHHLRSRSAQHDGDTTTAESELTTALALADLHGLPSLSAEIHKALRDLSRQRNDLDGYIHHNDAFTRIRESTTGRAAAERITMLEAQKTIDAERAETERHRTLLYSTLPKHIADRVARGEVVNDAFDNAAVLFLDIAGFTTNSSALDAGVVVELLQNIFTTFDAICEQHDVMKIKTIGDSYMAVAFGTANVMPSGVEAQRTANTEQRAANVIPRLAVEQRIANVACAMMSSPFTWPHTNERVMFRIGLHCGPVVAGVLGTERLQYDVWGDTVNVASRMESTSEPGRIHVSASFAEALNSPPSPLSRATLEKGNMLVVERGMVEIKGKGAMRTYWLEGE